MNPQDEQLSSLVKWYEEARNKGVPKDGFISLIVGIVVDQARSAEAMEKRIDTLESKLASMPTPVNEQIFDVLLFDCYYERSHPCLSDDLGDWLKDHGTSYEEQIKLLKARRPDMNFPPEPETTV